MEEAEKATALYVRVSTDAQFEEGYSAEAQTEMLKGYCASRGIKNYRLYVDGGWSGSNIDRPEISRLIGDCKNGEIASVAVYKLDRLSRSQKDTLYLIEDVFNPNGIAFVSLNENMDTSTPIGRAMLGIMSAFAQLERETIRERTRMGMKERIKKGFWRGGGKLPFGYDYDSESGSLVPNEDAVRVKMMYEMYLSGMSMRKISEAMGLKYERMAAQILRRRTNTGVIVYNGEEYAGRHEAIIPEETFARAAEEMKRRENGASGLAKPENLLSGLLVCGVCGSKMRYQKWGKNGRKIYCYSQDSSKPHLARCGKCSNIRFSADEIENAVVGDLLRYADVKPGATDDSDGGAEEFLSGLLRSREALEKKLRRLYDLYASSGDGILLDTISENRRALASLEKEIEERKKSFPEAPEKLRHIKELLLSVSQSWSLMEYGEKKQIIRECIEKVLLSESGISIYYVGNRTANVNKL